MSATATQPPPVAAHPRIEKDARGLTTIVYDAILPHPRGGTITQTFTRIVGDPEADPATTYNDPWSMAVYRVIKENERLKVELGIAQSKAARK